MERQLTLTTLHGDTDFAAVKAYRAQQQTRLGVPEDRQTEPACEAVAVFTSDNGSRAEVHFNDWADVAALKVGLTATLTIGA